MMKQKLINKMKIVFPGYSENESCDQRIWPDGSYD